MYRDKRRYGQKPEIVVRSKPPTFNKPLKVQREVERGKRPEAWQVIRQCPDLIFQVLTKLTERIGDNLPPFWDEIKGRIWLGYSCGMPGAEGGIKHLIRHDSAVRFLSCEPLLGELDIKRFLCRNFSLIGLSSRIDWVIVGGESGPQARPTDPLWTISLLRQCREANIPFFLKQMGTVWARENGSGDRHGGDIADWPLALRVREFPQIEMIRD